MCWPLERRKKKEGGEDIFHREQEQNHEGALNLALKSSLRARSKSYIYFHKNENKCKNLSPFVKSIDISFVFTADTHTQREGEEDSFDCHLSKHKVIWSIHKSSKSKRMLQKEKI